MLATEVCLSSAHAVAKTNSLEDTMSPITTILATTKEYNPKCLQVGEAKSKDPSRDLKDR